MSSDSCYNDYTISLFNMFVIGFTLMPITEFFSEVDNILEMKSQCWHALEISCVSVHLSAHLIMKLDIHKGI